MTTHTKRNGRKGANSKRIDGTHSTNTKIKRLKNESKQLKKGGHGQSLPDLSSRDNDSAMKKIDYLAEMR